MAPGKNDKSIVGGYSYCLLRCPRRIRGQPSLYLINVDGSFPGHLEHRGGSNQRRFKQFRRTFLAFGMKLLLLLSSSQSNNTSGETSISEEEKGREGGARISNNIMAQTNTSPRWPQMTAITVLFPTHVTIFDRKHAAKMKKISLKISSDSLDNTERKRLSRVC